MATNVKEDVTWPKEEGPKTGDHGSPTEQEAMEKRLESSKYE